MVFHKVPETVSIGFRVPRKHALVRIAIPTSVVALLMGVMVLSAIVLVSAGTPSIPVTVDLKPETLNLKSNGKWIQAKIVDYEDYFEYYYLDVGDISDVELWVTGIDGDPVSPDAISLDWDIVKPTSSGIVAIKLDREDVISGIQDALSAAGVSPPVDVTLKLKATADGIALEGEDTVHVLPS